MKVLKDSYTGEEAVEYYTSTIPGINEPRGLYKERELSLTSAEYRADREIDGRFSISRVAQPCRQLPSYPLCSVANELWARCMLEWLVIHDRVLLRILDNFMENPDAYFDCVELAMRETMPNG